MNCDASFGNVMQEVTLTIYDVETGDEEQVRLDSRRFTIGRVPENDLMIDDPNLSRRHAIIETLDESITISDCGSQNGTFVNDRPVIGTVQLHDGDVLTFGGSKEITVEISRELISESSSSNRVSGTQMPSKNPVQRAGQAASVFGAAPSWLNAPVVATAAAVLILLVAGLLLALNRGSDSAPPQNSPASITSENSSVARTPDDNVKPESAADSTDKPKDDLAS